MDPRGWQNRLHWHFRSRAKRSHGRSLCRNGKVGKALKAAKKPRRSSPSKPLSAFTPRSPARCPKSITRWKAIQASLPLAVPGRLIYALELANPADVNTLMTEAQYLEFLKSGAASAH